MSTDVTITAIFVGFFVLLALLTFMRLLLRKTEPSWRRIRLGVFVERDPDREKRKDEDEPPKR